MTQPFNPLDMGNLAHSIVTRMVETEPTPLSDKLPRFTGAGLYAIYYRGAHPVYFDLAAKNVGGQWQVPIYVGKAVPGGGRRGLEVADHGTTTTLWRRIREHARSIDAATDLDIADFAARWLIVEDIWIPLGESAMLREHHPVWNALVDGFGNHDPGKGRVDGKRSRWDTMHPGRSWAPKYPPREETAADIAQDIREYLRQWITP